MLANKVQTIAQPVVESRYLAQHNAKNSTNKSSAYNIKLYYMYTTY